jgi:hypothetical protein
LHEEPLEESLPDVQVIVFTGELSTGTPQAQSVHDPGELLPNIVCRLQGTTAYKIVKAPLSILSVYTNKEELMN